MNIGIDAKRAYYNRAGLGNYSRDIITALIKQQSGNKFFLYTPGKSDLFPIADNNLNLKTPESFFHKRFSSFWRSKWLVKDLKKYGIDIYHGLSNELPVKIEKSGIKSVVSIHDLIALRHPEYYPLVDRKIFQKKMKYSCHVADKIIAISQQSKTDIISFFGVDDEKIEVLYQGCNPSFSKKVTDEKIKEIKKGFQLPNRFLLTVGTIEPRKNMEYILKALALSKSNVPLVIVGKPTAHKKILEQLIAEKNLSNIIFLHGVRNEDLPALYQMADTFIYPSHFEGFGIPIIEALYSGTPVITNKEGVFPEVAGPSSIYVDIQKPEELAERISEIINNSSLREKMIADGLEHAKKFDNEKQAQRLIKIYEELK